MTTDYKITELVWTQQQENVKTIIDALKQKKIAATAVEL